MNFTKKELNELLEKYPLSARETMVLRYRFGLIDGNSHTKADTARLMGVTRQRIHQVEGKAWLKLKTVSGKKLST